MSRTPDIPKLLEAIKAAYGNLEQPNYSFMEKRCGVLRRHAIVTELMARYFVKDDTDLNDHAALHLRVRDSSGAMLQVCLSFVANFAMLFRFRGDSIVYDEVVDRELTDLRPIESDILALLEKYKFRLLSKTESATSIEMNLFNTESGDTRIYHAVIDDCGVVLDVLT